MRQLLYISSRPAAVAANIPLILGQSSRNNLAAGITGLLWTDEKRFLQVLEGDDAAVAVTFARIRADPRHQAVVVLSDRSVQVREFGCWSMAHRRAAETIDLFDDRLERLLAGASAGVRGTFTGLVSARRAA